MKIIFKFNLYKKLEFFKIHKETLTSVIELACGEYGEDKIEPLVAGTENGRSLQWFDKSLNLLDQRALRGNLSF